MNANGIKTGDIVECDVRGDIFLAYVERAMHDNATMGRKVVEIGSATGRPIPARFVTSRQIQKHWRKSKQSKE